MSNTHHVTQITSSSHSLSSGSAATERSLSVLHLSERHQDFVGTSPSACDQQFGYGAVPGQSLRWSSNQRYEPSHTIGRGAFGKIVKIRRIHAGGEQDLVWKELNLSKMSNVGRKQVVSEVNILRSLQKHPHIVRCYDAFTRQEGRKVFIVMEYCPRGDLAQLIDAYRNANVDPFGPDRTLFLEEHYVWKILGQLTTAVIACHWNYDKSGVKNPVLHRDLKPANVLLDRNGNVKLADFGLATNEQLPIQDDVVPATETGTRLVMGTPSYLSPERVNNDPYDERADIWSLGCILYELLTLRHPFETEDQRELFVNITSGNYQPLPPFYSQDLQRTCAWMLRLDVTQRPRIEDIANRVPQLRGTVKKIHLRIREENLTRKTSMMRTEYRRRQDMLWDRERQVVQRERELEKRERGLLARERTLQHQLRWRRGNYDLRSPHVIYPAQEVEVDAEQESFNANGSHVGGEGTPDLFEPRNVARPQTEPFPRKRRCSQEGDAFHGHEFVDAPAPFSKRMRACDSTTVGERLCTVYTS